MSQVSLRAVDRGRSMMQPAGLPAWAAALTVEGALYVLLLLAAAVTRFYALGRQPMQPEEAQLALAAGHFADSQGSSPAGYSPPLFWGTVLSFFILGANDLTARLVPALCGTLLVVTPYFLRRQLGRVGALAAAGLLLVSPSLLVASRTLRSDSLVALVSLGLVAMAARLAGREKGQTGGEGFLVLVLGSVLFALALMVGRDVYTLLLAGLIFLAALTLPARRRDGHHSGSATTGLALWPAVRELGGDSRLVGQAVAVFMGTFLLGSTGFFLHLGGVQASLDQLAAWLSAFAPTRTGYPWTYPLQTLIFYEPLALLFGLGGVVYLAVRRERFAGFLACWLGVALLVHTLPGGRGPAGSAAVALPLVLLAGLVIGRLIQGIADEGIPGHALVAVGVVLVLLTYGLLGYTFYLDNLRQDLVVSVALAFAGAAIVLVAVGTTWGARTGLRAAAVAAGIVLLILTVHMGAHAAYLATPAPAELLVPTAATPDVKNLVRVAEELSYQQLRDPHRLAVTVDRSLEPLLGWYLRDFVEVKFVSSVGMQPGTPLVIVPATGEYVALPGYLGQRFRLSTWWRPTGLSGRALGRWLFYRDPPTPPAPQDVILYVTR